MKTFIVTSEELSSVELVGIKAMNLAPYIHLTPEFIVLTTEFFRGWSTESTFLTDQNDTLTYVAAHFQQKRASRVILRSSCTEEHIGDRGRYLSLDCSPIVAEIRKALEDIYNDFQSQKGNDSLELAVLVQVFKSQKIIGHLSNERRVDISKYKWLLEEILPDSSARSKPFDTTNLIAEFESSPLRALNYNQAIRRLEGLAISFSNLPNRNHLEWLWDGSYIWLLQVDIEEEYLLKGIKPGSEWKGGKKSAELSELNVFETVSTTLNTWRKIECVRTFEKCGLPFWPIYILENSTSLGEVNSGVISPSLESDLKRILECPIVIRTDTTRQDLLAPRTETVSTFEEASNFLINTTRDFVSLGYQTNEFCFLIHQFIASIAGALAYTKPNTDITRIDSTFGIVETLYYHPYDSFEFNKNSSAIIKKVRRKSNYFDVNTDGKWYLKEAGNNYDWRESLTDRQVRIIANYVHTIAKTLARPVNVMFFINDKKKYPEVLPWFYTLDEFSDSATVHSNSILAKKYQTVIRTKEDFEKLTKNSNASKKLNIFIDLSLDFCRNKEFIEAIAAFAKANNYTIDIKGSMLSHPYYVFQSKGVNIRCINPFQTDYDAKKFYKLVRDKIPAFISNTKDEKVKAKRVSPAQLLPLLKEKIVEEANELHWSQTDDNNIEEMSDVLEVLRGLCKLYGLNLNDLSDIADKKREIRGGFEDGIVLIATKEQSAVRLLAESTDLFADVDKEIDVRTDQRKQFFQKGHLSNLRSLSEVSEIHLPYVNVVSPLSNKFRYFIKNEDYNSIVIEYGPKDITLTLERVTTDDYNHLQLELFK